jgi:hypothetical protein
MQKKLAIALFCLCIGLPLVLMGFGLRGERIDNRPARATAPLSWQGIKSGAWFTSVNDAFIDRIPLRDKAVRLNATIDWHLLGETGNAQVAVGRNGWLFFAESIDQPCIAPSEIRRRFDRLAEVAQAQKEADGTRILWLIVPDKAAIYPEHLTPLQQVRSACARSNRAAMRELLRDSRYAPTIFGLWEALEAAKSRGQLYHATDTHWNAQGAMVALDAFLNHWWPEVYRQSEMQQTSVHRFVGDLATMAGITGIEEQREIWQRRRNGLEGGKVPAMTCIPAGHDRHSYHYRSSVAPLVQGKTAILRDSFFGVILPYLPPFFASMDISHIARTPSEQWPAIARCADTLIIETAERYMLERAETFGQAMP